MNPRITLPALALVAFLISGAGRANATFLGKNGRIAFVVARHFAKGMK